MKIAVNTTAVTCGDMDFSELEKLGETVYFDEVTREELYDIARDCDAIIINKVIIDGEFLKRCPKIRYVGLFATGYNVVDVDACNAAGVTVCNVPDYSANAVCQHVFALLLSVLDQINAYTDSVKRGDWISSPTFTYHLAPTYELYGKKFGIFGYGSIGKTVAKVAAAFGADVLICTRTPKEHPYKSVTFEELLRESDILSLHCPLTAQTNKIIDNRALSLMKKNAILINTARGGLVDEKALAEALNKEKIAAACLDTVAEEPMRADNPLHTAKNCVITPHTAWIPKETRQRLLKIATENLAAYVAGKPQNTVNHKK